MISAKTADTNLAGLTSTSLVAVWRLVYYVYAVSIHIHEAIFDLFKEDIEFTASVAPQAITQWYAEETKVFQYGDNLVFQSFDITDSDGITRPVWRLDYATIDTTKQIASLAAATDESGLIKIKAAKVVSGVAQKLSAPEKTALETYWLKKRFAGTPIVVISQDPDLMKLQARIVYNPLIMDSSGESLASPGTFPVEDAIDTFLATFQGSDFGAEMKVMKLVTAIENTEGVINCVVTQVECKTSTGSYSDILAVTNQSYIAEAGYLAIDGSFPLSSNLTYVS